MIKKIFNYKKLPNNDKIVLKNTFFAFIIKGFSLLLAFLTTPLFIKYFNNDVVLGVWYTILSVLIWFLNFDLGIGNGIRNELVIAITKNDRIEAKKIISSGFFSSLILTIILTIIGMTLLLFVNLNNFFNISVSIISKETLLLSVIMVFIAIMIRFFLTIVSSIFYALQKSSINNFIALFISVFQFSFVLCFKFDNLNTALLNLSFAYMIISNLPVLIAGIVVFISILKDCRPNIKFISKQTISKILKVGGLFFVCQILYMLIINTNELLITRIYGPESTTIYTYYYKLTSLISMVVTLAMTPIWSIVTKAMVEENWNWLNNLFSKIKKIGLLIVLLEFLLIPFLQLIMNIWLGNGVVEVNYLIALSFSFFGSTFVYSSMLSTIVCGLGKMKLQAFTYLFGNILKFSVVIALNKFFNDWSLVVWMNVIVLFIYIIFEQVRLNKLFKTKLALANNIQEI